MDKTLYNMIPKRKSFHLFRNTGKEKISSEELEDIMKQFEKIEPLVKDIKVDIKIVPADETTCKRGQEYCILLYSENKDNYLQNIGYIGEQLDLYLTSKNIGTLWYGMGKANEQKLNNLEYVIMIAIKKVPEDKFRKDMLKSKRKTIDEIWNGKEYLDIANIVRFAPSACNSQPWLIESKEKELLVYRYKKPGKIGIMPKDKMIYYNKIDIGIFLLFLELSFQNQNIKFEKEIFNDTSMGNIEKTLVAKYTIQS